jgi:hypothetical protein
MKLIETKTLEANASSIEFTDIPQFYTDLMIVTSFRTSRAAGIEGLLIAFNGSSANFNYRLLAGTGTTAFGDGNTFGRGAVVNGNSSTANTFANQSIYIENYSGSTFKTYNIDSAQESKTNDNFESFL